MVKLFENCYLINLDDKVQRLNDSITELSKLEVEARRIRNTSYLIDRVNDINKSIDHLEKLILMASLMR